MSASYRNIINTNELQDAIGSGDFSKVLKKGSTSAKYIKGYAKDSGIEALGIDNQLFQQFFGIEDKKLDAYDPYHTQDSKIENFWYSEGGGRIDGKTVQQDVDEDTNTFKRSLYTQYGFRDDDFLYEDPFYPSFEISFDEDSPFFLGSNDLSTDVTPNTLKSFINKYIEIDPVGYGSRFKLWVEFKKVFFKIFEKDTNRNSNRNLRNKAYYITKIAGLNNLNKKIINFPEDKITLTITEDVSMLAWYLSELYNNIAYNYKNQRFAVPENVLRFNMTIKINEVRNFVTPQSYNESSATNAVDKNNLSNTIKNLISPKSQIIYTLHDCTFNFFESKNYSDDIEIGGYNNPSYTPQILTFDILFKSVTRWSEFPLIKNSYSINPWEKNITDLPSGSTKQSYYADLNKIKTDVEPEKKGYLNQMISSAGQNVLNVGLNYVDNLEAKLREVRGGVVNDLLSQFKNSTTINKIEPDNVYNSDFNNRTSIENLGKQIASSLLTDLESGFKNALNF
jgi:hypothetical protein